jgi:hypothetical protein
MKTYEVTVYQVKSFAFVTEVEAESEEQAGDLARDEAFQDIRERFPCEDMGDWTFDDVEVEELDEE